MLDAINVIQDRTSGMTIDNLIEAKPHPLFVM